MGALPAIPAALGTIGKIGAAVGTGLSTLNKVNNILGGGGDTQAPEGTQTAPSIVPQAELQDPALIADRMLQPQALPVPVAKDTPQQPNLLDLFRRIG